MPNFAVDDATAIKARMNEMAKAKAGIPSKRLGTSHDHCGHCPQQPQLPCLLNCREEARRQGWYTREAFGDPQ